MFTTPVKRDGEHSRRPASHGARRIISPAFIGVLIARGLSPNSPPTPAVSTLLFVLATMSALVAWVRCSTDEYGANAT